ncbi:hypothetical protein J6590_072243 [Homalodisca vitripennis]|nr:hypothetical protein J6590_072243 [Homalodisca vitripennis]
MSSSAATFSSGTEVTEEMMLASVNSPHTATSSSKESKSPDNCNGSFAGQQYFTCKPGCGKFVTVNELRLVDPPRYTPSPPMVSRHSATNTYQSSVSVWLEDKPARPSSTDPLASSKSGRLYFVCSYQLLLLMTLYP